MGQVELVGKRLTARQAAFEAGLRSYQGICFVEDYLAEWKKLGGVSQLDFNLAFEIGTGAVRKALLLDHLAFEVPRKGKEKVLLRQALYQVYFLDRIPLYAISNESQEIAKKRIHPSFARFLNHKLRSILSREPDLSHLPDFIKYSYPEFFVKMLSDEGKKEVLESFEKKPAVFKRIPLLDFEPLKTRQEIENALNEGYYLQNPTPATLFARSVALLEKKPEKVLDLAASPGGKTLLARDFFKQASLFCNDLSKEKVDLIRDNLKGEPADFTIGSAENFPQEKGPFDLIIVDAPCSNSGVLHRRAEARWRINDEELKEMVMLQLSLLSSAAHLLASGGALLYMTCSVLSAENERVVHLFLDKYPSFKLVKQETILPNREGWDGGFAALLVQVA